MQLTTVAETAGEQIEAILGQPPAEVEAPPNFSDEVFQRLDFAAIAIEFARGMYPPKDILRRFGLTEKQGLFLVQHPPFKKLVQEQKRAWESSGNAGERAKLLHQEGQAFVASELISMILDTKLPATVRLDAAKLSAKIAGIDAPPKDGSANGQGPVGNSFSVNIHLGDGKVERITASAAPMLEARPEP